jgi:hypothetical protein
MSQKKLGVPIEKYLYMKSIKSQFIETNMGCS